MFVFLNNLQITRRAW